MDRSEEEDDLEEESPVLMVGANDWSGVNLSFAALLRHYATYTGQDLSAMTYLLKMLKRHRPKPDYDSLPSTGEQLLHIDNRDFYGEMPEQQATDDSEESENGIDLNTEIHSSSFN